MSAFPKDSIACVASSTSSKGICKFSTNVLFFLTAAELFFWTVVITCIVCPELRPTLVQSTSNVLPEGVPPLERTAVGSIKVPAAGPEVEFTETTTI